MSDLINRIADAIEAEIHEAWTESDADFIRGMEYAISIVKAVDIRTDGDTISRADAMGAVQDHFNAGGFKGYDDGQKMMDRIKALPSAEQVTGKLKNPDDSLLTADSEACKEQKSKLDLISRQDAIRKCCGEKCGCEREDCGYTECCSEVSRLEQLPSAPDSRQRGEWVRLEREENVYDLHGVPTYGVNYMCDKCGFITTAIQDHFAQYRWCPSCGARMYKGGEEE